MISETTENTQYGPGFPEATLALAKALTTTAGVVLIEGLRGAMCAADSFHEEFRSIGEEPSEAKVRLAERMGYTDGKFTAYTDGLIALMRSAGCYSAPRVVMLRALRFEMEQLIGYPDEHARDMMTRAYTLTLFGR